MSQRYRNWTYCRVNLSIQNNVQNDEVDAMKAHLNIILEICLQPMSWDRIDKIYLLDGQDTRNH